MKRVSWLKAGHSNTIFSVRDIVRGTDGAVLQSYDYKENGEKTTSNPSGSKSDKTWVGGLSVNDDTADSGLYLMGHRHYDAALGRFLSRDPIGFVGGLNLYEYVENSPVSKVDPLGLDPSITGQGAPIPTIQIQLRPKSFGEGGIDLGLTILPLNAATSEGRVFVEVTGTPARYLNPRSRPSFVAGPSPPVPVQLYDIHPYQANRAQPCPPHGRRFHVGSPLNYKQSLRFSMLGSQLYDAQGRPRFEKLQVRVSVVGISVIPGVRSGGPIEMFEYGPGSGAKSSSAIWEIDFGSEDVQFENF